MKTLGVGLALFAAMALTARAQSTFGNIVGTVQDQSGAVVPAVEIQVTNLDSQATRNVVSSETGQYSILNLLAGRYSLVAKKSGFATTRIEDIGLDARQERRVDIVIGVAETTDTVTVEATTSAINTENGTIARSIDNRDITSLPMNYRGSATSPLAAIVSLPNVQQDNQGNITVGGTQPYLTRYSVDGTNNNQVLGGDFYGGEAQKNNYPSTEMLSEFRVSAVSNNAEYQSPGDVTITTKSGSNVFHGSLFEYLQNRDLDATVYGSPTKQGKAWNTFGGSLSGPIFRNRTFFFVDYEGNQKPGSQLITGSVPTVAMRNGDLNGVPGPPAINPATGAPFPSNQIPASQINSVASAFLANYYPAPNFNSGSTANDYREQVPSPSTTNGYDVRIDENFGSKNQLFGRWDWKNVNNTGGLLGANNGLLGVQPVPQTNRNVTIADTHNFSPNLLNEFRFGFARQQLDEGQFPYKGKQVEATLGFTGLDLSGPNMQGNGPFPGINFSDGTGFTSVAGGTGINADNRVVQYIDNVSWIKGKHTMKFGAMIYFDLYTQSTSFIQGDELGSYTFNQGVFSGNAYANFLLGEPTSNFLWIPGLPLKGHTGRYGFYAQDEYHVTSRLTVSYGLRYSILPGIIDSTGDITSFLQTPKGTGTFVLSPLATSIPTAVLYEMNLCPGANPGWTGVAGAPFPCTPTTTKYGPRTVKTDYGDFTPRLGVAWRPFGNNKTVFRGGIGLFTVANASGTSGFGYSGSLVNNGFFYNVSSTGTPLSVWPQGKPSGSGLTPGVIGTYEPFVTDPTLKNSAMTQWNVSIERDLGKNWTLDLNYIGSHTAGLRLGVDLNQLQPSAQPYNPALVPYPNYSKFVFDTNVAFSNYQAFNPAVEHRYSNGLSLRADYTLAKSLGNAGGDAPQGFYRGFEGASGDVVADRFNLREMRGNDGGTRRHRILLTAVYELPVGKGKALLSNSNAVVDEILSGWQLSTVTLIQSGAYQTPVISCALSQANTNDLQRGARCRPDAIGDPNLSNPTPNEWWNINAFVPTPVGAGREGDAGVGTLETPGTVAISAGLAKNFKIAERFKLRLEGTFTNLPNHPNFAPPPSVVSDPSTFGKVVTTQSSENSGNRTGQVSLRLDF
jgi:hypothetical protein